MKVVRLSLWTVGRSLISWQADFFSPASKGKSLMKTSGVRRKAWGVRSGSFVFGVRFLWRHNLTSFMFPNQRFGEVCWHNMHILLHALSLFFCHCSINYQRSKLSKTLINSSEQFTSAKWGYANIFSNTSSQAQKQCGWTGRRTPQFARMNLAKPHKNWKWVQSSLSK